MSANNSSTDGGQDKPAGEKTMQTVPQNLTTIQSIQTVSGVQTVVPSTIQTLQAAGTTVTGQTTTLVGKSIAVELHPKMLKQQFGANIVGASDSKITSTICAVPGSTVRIITPSMISSIERQPQVQQTTQQTNIPSTYHVPRGPAAVASISTPRATVATPLRAISQPIPISRPGNPTIVVGARGSTPIINVPSTEKLTFARVSVIDYCKAATTSQPRIPLQHDKLPRVVGDVASYNLVDLSVPRSTTLPSTTVSNTQWQPKTSVVYAQPQRQPVPVVRPPTRPATATVYTSQPQQTQAQQQQTQQQQQQQPRLVTPGQISLQGRPIQATVVTATPRLVTPVQLQASNSTITRLPVPTRPTTPQVVTSLPQVSQAGRPVQQTIQPNQTSRTISTPINRIAVTAPVIGAANRVAAVTSVQTSVGRQLTINTAAGASTGTVSRIVIPQQAIQQQQQQQQQQQNAPRVVQTVTPVNFSQVSRVIATTSTAAGVARVAQTGATPVARIAGMSLHPLPLTPARATPQGTSLKVTTQTPTGTTIQAVQLKQGTTTILPQQQQSQQQQQQQQQQQTQSGQSNLPRQIASLNSVSVASTSAASQQPTQVQGQYLHSQHTTYYSIEPSGAYSQYRQTSVQPVRLLVEQGYEQEPLVKPNASPRPSILRKREHDGSPGKLSVAKNLVPVLASLPTTSSHVSPPNSPKGDRDNGGNHSSGSTTVSATSSPGLDEEPEQSRITINPTVEMSPRKKPRKQQLTGVELTESMCKEDMLFITEEKIRKDLLNIKEEPKDKYGDRKHGSSSQQEAKSQQAPTKNRPTLLGPGYKTQFNGRMHHFKRPSDVKAKVENKPTIYEMAQEKDVMKKLNGWKVHHLTAQMQDLASTEKSVFEKLRGTLTMLESQQSREGQNDHLEKVNELIKGNMQRSNLISDGMDEARTQLKSIFVHKPRVAELLQRCMNKRAQKKREK